MITVTQLAIILFTILLGALLSWMRRSNKHDRLVPRGPLLQLPIVGHLLFLGSQPPKTLLKWRAKYGPMYRIQLGSFETVVINDGQLIRKAFKPYAMSGRPKMPINDAIGSNRKDIIFGNFPHVGELRHFYREHYKDFAGNLTQPLEHRILAEVDNLISTIRAAEGTPLSIHGFFHISIVNSLLELTAGFKCPPGDSTSEKLKTQITEVVQIRGLPELFGMFIPKFCQLAPNWSGLQRRIDIINSVNDFFTSIVDEHKATLIKGQPRDMIDAFLEKGGEPGAENSTFGPQAGHLLPFLFDVFSAGMETTSTQLEWIIYYMVKHPEIQAKVQDEIDNFIGVGRRPCLEDRTSMLFVEAVLQESLRFASISPLGLYHSALEDYEFNGYVIPKDTVVIGNIYAAHHDPAVWGDPEVFRPDRFIDPEATGRLKKYDELVPFGWGKRRCIGEDLARQELFLFTVSILQQFVITAVGELPTQESFGIAVAPSPFKVMLNPRV